MSDITDRERFVQRGQEVLALAWDISGRPGVTDETEVEARLTNGLIAIAIVEIMARPVHGRFASIVDLRDVLKDSPDV
jgi:hypothetical protein